MSTKKKTTKRVDLGNLEIDELKQLIGDARKEIELKEKATIRELRSRIEKMVSDAGMTLEQVLNVDKKKGKSASKPGAPRYRNPENPEQTWTGHGKRPRWFLDAEARDITPEQMAIRP